MTLLLSGSRGHILLTALSLCILSACTTVASAPASPTTPSVNISRMDEMLANARTFLDAGDVSKAYGIAKLAVNADPNNIDAHEILGISALADGEIDDAVASLTRVHSVRPTPDIEGFLGLALLRNSQKDEAKPFLMSSLAADKTQWRQAFALAEIELEAGDAETALELLTLAGTHSDKTALIEQARGQAYLLMDRPSDALAALKTAQSLTEGRLGSGLPYRKALAGTGRVELALRDATSMEKGEIYRSLAQSALARGDADEAVAHLKQARRLFPRLDPHTEDLMTRALAASGQSGD